MVQPQYGVQPGYGAPPPQYGAGMPGQGMPGAVPGFGAPPMGGQAMPPAEIKWSGLSTGGAFKIPVISFIGRLTEVVKDFGNQYGLRIVEKYDQVQILESPVPWPWATIDVSIKYSDKESSAWGYHVASAKAIGLAQNAATLDEALAEMVGRAFELRQTAQSYGDDKVTGQPMTGDVWRFQRIVVPGQAQAFPQPQYAIPQPVPVAQPVPIAQPVPVAIPDPAMGAPPPPPPIPVPMPNVVAAPVAVAIPPVRFNPAPDPSDTAPVRAKKLLHGRALNEWLGVALIDDKVKADPAFINTIYDQSFIVGLKAQNQVVQGADGRFTVTG